MLKTPIKWYISRGGYLRKNARFKEKLAKIYNIYARKGIQWTTRFIVNMMMEPGRN